MTHVSVMKIRDAVENEQSHSNQTPCTEKSLNKY